MPGIPFAHLGRTRVLTRAVLMGGVLTLAVPMGAILM
jgi:hypothetical protein